MAIRYPHRLMLAGAAVALMGVAVPARAQSSQCQKLQQNYQQEIGSGESLKSKAAQQAMQSGSSVLSSFGIQLNSPGNAQQAIQKGALAATNPQMQNAIIIQLLSANAHLQEMMWRGCKPSRGERRGFRFTRPGNTRVAATLRRCCLARAASVD